jgi:hypothetical protein
MSVHHVIKSMLLEAPEGQIDKPLMDLIQKWDEPPTSLQILEVRDLGAYTAGTSDFTISVMDMAWKSAMKAEGVTEESLIAQATWRKDHV